MNFVGQKRCCMQIDTLKNGKCKLSRLSLSDFGDGLIPDGRAWFEFPPAW
jgi:hypothetical protein